jgi:hypothetical protein
LLLSGSTYFKVLAITISAGPRIDHAGGVSFAHSAALKLSKAQAGVGWAGAWHGTIQSGPLRRKVRSNAGGKSR